MIEHANIIWLRMIDGLGGLETYVYELVKKYHHLDIAVVCNYCDYNQRLRLEKYCRVYIHNKQQIKCNVCITNYDISIIPYLNEDAKIYETIHGDYTSGLYDHGPATDDRITGYITITHYLEERMVKYLDKSKIVFSYNPLTIEKDEKPIIIVSATRLHKTKGKDRMQILANKLDEKDINYIWYVFTNEREGINSPNVIFLKNRLDISKWLVNADYVCLLSDTEACSYTLNEALYRNIPIICTPLPYLDEIGVKDGLNAYIMKYDCSNVDDIVNKIEKIPKFNFKHLEDRYSEILQDSESRYEEEKEMNVKVKCIREYEDMEIGKHIFVGEIYEVSKIRADFLAEHNVIEIIEEPKEEKKEVKSKAKKTKK